MDTRMVVRGLKVLPRAKIFHVKKNLGEHFYNLGIGKDFFRCGTKGTITKLQT